MTNEGNRIIRNNVDTPIIVSEDDRYYKVESINERNMQKLGIIETYAIPFKLEVEKEGHCVLKVYNKPDECILIDDLSVVCIVEEVEYLRYDDIRDYNVHLFRQSVLERINMLSCDYLGVHIVSEWENGSSDATILPLYTATDFKREFPDADTQQVLAFYAGRGDGFVVREWQDDDGSKVTDKVYYCCDTQRLKEVGEKWGINDKFEVYIDDDHKFLEITMNIREFKSLRKDK